jgi:hypothetical protein
VAAVVSIVPVALAKADFFPDLTPIPQRLWRAFNIEVFDDMTIDGDWAVSDSIKRHGVWEPVETAVMSSAFAGNPGSWFVDIGCHVGWYTAIARSWGLPTLAVDVSELCLAMLERRHDDGIAIQKAWIDSQYKAPAGIVEGPVIMKMDIEGAEQHAVKAWREWFIQGDVTHCLMEISPVFNASYPHIVNNLVALGYECWVLPLKQTPPPILDDTRTYLLDECTGLHLLSERDRRRWINHWPQFNAVFTKEGSKWG